MVKFSAFFLRRGVQPWTATKHNLGPRKKVDSTYPSLYAKDCPLSLTLEYVKFECYSCDFTANPITTQNRKQHGPLSHVMLLLL